MKTRLRFLCFFATFVAFTSLPIFGVTNWGQIVSQMETRLDAAVGQYQKKDLPGARDLVNEAYFSFYEKEGMERAVLSKISSQRASIVEYQFATVKKAILTQQTEKKVSDEIQRLTRMLREDAGKLDGRSANAWTSFLGSFVLLTREGIEAILVIGAILTFLIRSGNQRQSRVIYLSSAAALVASALTAFALQGVFQASGASQELLEGVVMLSAVAVLFFVSHWMVSKAESSRWQNYINGKIQTSVTTGNSVALALTCFLAVYREGAETVLFYQALFLEGGKFQSMIWLGMAAGALVLAGLFLAIRYGSLKIPLKPFFWTTGILMYLMAFTFAGGGVKELQEGDWLSVTAIPGLPSVDLLGIYPTWETLAPQLFLLMAAIVAVPFYRGRGRSQPKA